MEPFKQLYTWGKGDIDALVKKLVEKDSEVKEALDSNGKPILAAASRYFQATRSKITANINRSCNDILSAEITSEEARKEILTGI